MIACVRVCLRVARVYSRNANLQTFVFFMSDKSVVQSIVEQLECEMKMEKTRANEGASGAEQGCGYRKGIVGQ